MLRRVRMKKGLVHAISPDPNFDWSRKKHKEIRSIFKKKNSPNNKIDSITKSFHNGLPITSKMFSKLGVEVQFDRRLCLAGQKLRGFLMPKSRSLQVLIMKGFLKWYSSCIQIEKKVTFKCSLTHCALIIISTLFFFVLFGVFFISSN